MLRFCNGCVHVFATAFFCFSSLPVNIFVGPANLSRLLTVEAEKLCFKSRHQSKRKIKYYGKSGILEQQQLWWFVRHI